MTRLRALPLPGDRFILVIDRLGDVIPGSEMDPVARDIQKASGAAFVLLAENDIELDESGITMSPGATAAVAAALENYTPGGAL